MVNGDSRLCVRKITSDLNNSLPKPVSVDTVRRYLKTLGYEYVVRVKKQWLSAKHRTLRVEWCQRYSGWTSDDWGKVIFSDGSTFYVLKRKNLVKIWRLEKEKLLPGCLEQANTGDGGKFGIGGAISAWGTVPARIYSINMNSDMYIDVLQNELNGYINKNKNKNEIIYQHDLAPWHTSNVIKQKIRDLKLNLLNWAPKSPDLNPIEMLWSIIDKKIGCDTNLFQDSFTTTSQ